MQEQQKIFLFLNMTINKKEYMKEWRANHKEYQKEYHKNYYEKNKGKLKVYDKETYEKKKEIHLFHAKQWYNNNRERIRANHRRWEHKNRINIYEKNKKITNPIFRMRKNLSERVRRSVKNNKKNFLNDGLIDYMSIIEHLKPFPIDMDNYHIDHIIPLSCFDLTNPEQVKLAFAPQNHQWLLKEDNLSKGDVLKGINNEKINGRELKSLSFEDKLELFSIISLH